MDIAIDKQKVIEDVLMNVSIVARNLVDSNRNSLYDKVRIQERDNDLVRTYVDASHCIILKELNSFIETNDGDNITLANNRRLNNAAISDLPVVIHNYMVNYAAAEWMKIKAVEFAPVFIGRSEEHLKTIFEKLRFKTEPVMKKYKETV